MPSKRVGVTHDYDGNEIAEVDQDFVAWMTAHEETVRQAWTYDEIWADESVSLLPSILVVAGGVVIDDFYMSGIMGKWQKHKYTDGATHLGSAISTITEVLPNYKFVARRASNRITGEVLFYKK